MAGRELRGRLLAHWELKLLSLAAAAVLWFLVVSGEKAEVTLSAPLEFASIPAGLEVSSERPDSVDVQIQGLRSTLARLSGDDLRAHVRLAGTSAGESTVRLLPENIRTPAGVTVLRVTPSRVRVVLEPSDTTMVRVAARLTGRPAEGYRVSRVVVSPPEVEVRGPRSEIVRWKQVETHPIDLSGLAGTVTRRAALGGLTNSVRVVGDRGVEVTLEVTEETATRQITGVPLMPESSAWRARVIPPSVDVLVRGPLSRVKDLTAAQVRAVLDLRGLGPRVHRLMPRITLPPGVELVQIEPPRVTVREERP